MSREVRIGIAFMAVSCFALAPAVVSAQPEEGASEEEAAAEEAPVAEEPAPEPEPEPMVEPEPEPEPMAEPEPMVEPEPVAEPAAAAPAAAAGEEPEEILVTGTRIKRKGIATAAPVTVLSREDLLGSGMMSVGEILQNLPANANAINVQFNNGGTGATRVDLRGLASNRTLVLVNGRRHVPGGTGANDSVDLNAIPISIIERVEVLKDGASAIYGSDAIGGVVNVITRRDFDGVEATGYSGITQRGDGRVYDISATTGAATGKANIVFSASFYDQESVWAGDRDFSKTDKQYFFDPEVRAEEGRDFQDLGSPGTPQGTMWYYPNADESPDYPGNQAWQDLITGACAADSDGTGYCYNDPVAGWRTFNGAGNSDTGDGDLYNYQPENYLMTPQRRLGLWASGGYDLSQYFRPFFEASYTNRRSSQQLAPTPLYTWSEDITVSALNQYNPYNRDFIDLGRRMSEAGTRDYNQNIHTFRLVLGVGGVLPDLGPLYDWSWDFNVNFGRTEGTQTNAGRFVRSRVAAALGPSFQDSDGVWHCGAPGSEVDGCVPLNLFGGEGSITDEMLDYISYTGVARGFSDQRIASLNVGGPIYELVPNNPIAVAAGYVYRREAGGYQPDPIEASGDTTGNKSEPVKGRYDQHAGYIELSLPVVGGITGVKLLELSAAARLFDYSTFGFDNTYKFGGRWQITDWLAARGTYSTAFRAPSVNELYSGQSDSFPLVSDPCADATQRTDNPNDPDRTDVDRNCDEIVGTAVVNDSSSQLKTRVGGNQELDPETAKIFTAGVVLEASLVKGLSAAVDYWNVNIDNAIQPVGAGVILTSCYQAASADERRFCDLINRGANNKIVSINDTLTNVGGVKTHGMDLDVRYSQPTPVGRVGGSVEATVLFDYIQVQPDGYEWSFKNNYDAGSASSVSNGGVYPGWKANATLLWALENYNAGVNFRFIPGYKECNTSDLCNQKREEGEDAPFSRDVDSNLTMDIFAGYSFDTFVGATDLTVGVNNVTDQDPPIIYTGFLGSSDASTYDYMGRYFYVRLGQRF